jgi:spore maturation protein SpmB
LVGILAVKLLQGLPLFRAMPDEVEAVDHNGETVAKKFQLTTFRRAVIVIAALGFALGAWFEFAPQHRDAFLKATGLQSVLDASAGKKKMAEERKAEIKKQAVDATAPAPATEVKPATSLRERLMTISALAIPFILMVTVLWGLAYGVPVYEEMVEGAKEGFGVATRIMPFLVVMLTGLTIFRESGAMLFLEYALRPVLDLIQMPVELLPLAMMRPLSGSGSSGILNEIILNPSSSDFLRYTAATMFGSTETTFYVLAVYFGSVAVRKSRHAVAVGLLADVAGMGTALLLGRLLFA